MKLAILFWFYKEPEICQNRLQILRQYNPNTPIYGVYGGELATVDCYQAQLAPYLDDFYTFPEPKDTDWKWLQGDLILTQWYRERGKHLAFDTVVVVQWDMLIFGAIEQLFSMLEPDQILLSGLRPIAEIENDWHWVTPKLPDLRQKYLKFIEHVVQVYDYQQQPLACIFIVACLPRIFLERYATIEQPELGFIEYRIPIYAQIFGISICEHHPFEVWWKDVDPTYRAKDLTQRVINRFNLKFNPHSLHNTSDPRYSNISLMPIFKHLNMRNGDRIFHPHQYLFPLTKRQWLGASIAELKRDLDWVSQKILRSHSQHQEGV
jgi:hypothetical protein